MRPTIFGPVEPGLASAPGKAANAPMPPSPALPNGPAFKPDTALLELISSANLTRLLAAALPELTPAAAGHVDALLRSAAAAAIDGRVDDSLDYVSQAVALDPHRAESLSFDSRFEAVRAELDQLLAGFAYSAKLDAESRLSQASQTIESAAPHKTTEWLAEAAQLHSAALRLLDANTYVSYLRSAHVSQGIIDSASRFNPALNVFIQPVSEPEAPAFHLRVDKLNTPEPARSDPEPSKCKSRLLIIWRRAPLAVLLLGWLALGFGVFALSVVTRAPKSDFTLFYKIWSLGFLALVGFGFYSRIRNIRFGP